MDASDGLLAQRVAAAADAWLRDPQDTQVYARLVAATLAWRHGTGSATPERPELAQRAEPSTPIEPAIAVDLPPRLGDALGDVIADLHRRHRPSPDSVDPAPAPPTA